MCIRDRLGANVGEAIAHPQAVRNAVRNAMQTYQQNQQFDINGNDAETYLESSFATWEDVRKQKADATCTTIPLPELLRWSKHVAEVIMPEQLAQHRTLNGEPNTILLSLSLLLVVLLLPLKRKYLIAHRDPLPPSARLTTSVAGLPLAIQVLLVRLRHTLSCCAVV